MRHLPLASIAAFAVLASCSSPEIIPQPTPVPVPAPATPPPPSVPTPVLGPDWIDWPLAQGDWVYRQDARGSIALFGRAGADAELTLRCDKQRGRIYLSRRSEGAGPLTVRASTTLKTFELRPAGGSPAYAAVELQPRDPILDAVGFSRGRFLVQGGGAGNLVVPSWPEILRVAEDCRS